MSRIEKLRNQGKVKTSIMNNPVIVNQRLYLNKIKQKVLESRAVRKSRLIFINS